jgi:hypothetical protein
VNTTDIPRLVAAGTAARARLLDRVRPLSSAQGAFKVDPAEWSIAENVEHLVLAEQGSVNRVWAAADGLRRGQPAWSGESIHRGKPIEQIVRETWAPGQKAPDVATPRRRGPLAYSPRTRSPGPGTRVNGCTSCASISTCIVSRSSS